MPITCPVLIRPIGQEEFGRIAYQVMHCAFESQNSLGRLCDEVIYQNDLAARLQATSLGPVRKELPVTVTHRDFAKTYQLDLVIGDAAIYELKAESRLVPDHEAQLLNYLFLCGASHGKLVNFRPSKVESKFVNATLTSQDRKAFKLDARRWHDLENASRLLRTSMIGMLEDWGNCLELPLYLEALIHFLGGEETVERKVVLTRDGVCLGNQRVHLASPEIAFRLTALQGNLEAWEPHLCSLLRHSELRAIQWINMARHEVQFVTVTK